MKVAVLDNYDSFTYNLVEYISIVGPEPTVLLNDVDIEEFREIEPDAIVISPGPGHPANPSDIGVTNQVIQEYRETPMLGVCLGHQAMAEVFTGGVVDRADYPVHGKSSQVNHTGDRIHRGVPQGFHAGRYHSLVVKEAPDEFIVTGEAGDTIMAMKHSEHPMYGVQYHPESILTGEGQLILRNFLDIAAE